MSGYQLFISVLVIVMLIPLWVLMSDTTNTANDIFYSISPAYSDQYDIGRLVMYAYLFIVSIVLIMWVYKSGVLEKNQRGSGAYYG